MRRNKGQSLVELGTALIIIIPLVLALLNGAFVFLGATLNDSVCRDAARAAASGPPSRISPGVPRERAKSVIKRVYQSGLPMKVRETIEISETILDVPPDSTGGAVDGQVTVGTTIDVYPLYTLWGAGPLTMKAKHTVPITYVKPASQNPQ